MTKTYNIGEECEGGTIKVDIKKDLTSITITALEYKTQKEVNKLVYTDFHRPAIQFDLEEWTTHYWADKITTYITSKFMAGLFGPLKS